MGGAASSGKEINGAKEGVVISLLEAHKGMRLFQHKVSGEIIVLFNDDMESYLGPQAKGQYDEANLSRQQGDYLRQLKIKVWLPNANAISSVDFKSISEAAKDFMPPKVESSLNLPLNPPSVPQEDVIRKRMTNLRQVAMGDENTSDSYNLSEKGLSEPKHSKASADKRKKFTPQPYFPPSRYLKDSKLVEDLSRSLSEFHSAGAKEVLATERDMAKELSDKSSADSKENSERTSGPGQGGQRCRCSQCGETYFGRYSNEMLEDHTALCSADEDFRKELKAVDHRMNVIMEDIDNYSRGALEIIMQEALIVAAEEMDQLKEVQVRIKRLVKKAMGLQVNNASEKYAGKLRFVVDNELQALLRRVEGKQRLLCLQKQYELCLSSLTDCLNALIKKQGIVSRYGYLKPTVRDFKFLRILGKGGFAKVYLARKLDNNRLVAIKVMSKENIRQEKLEAQILRERLALATASKHTDLFVRFYCSFQTASSLFIVMEYMQGGDCMTLLTSLKRFPELVAQHFMAQVCLAVQHLHRNGVVHRDIKPDNVMVTAFGHVKLGDFGLVIPFSDPQSMHMLPTVPNTPRLSSSYHLAEHKQWLEEESSELLFSVQKTPAVPLAPVNGAPILHDILSTGSDSSFFQPPSFTSPSASAQSANATPSSTAAEPKGSVARKKLRSLVGNYHYACPELILRKGYDHSVDWWAVSVLCFHFVAGITPFEASNPDDTMDNIITGVVNWHAVPSYISNECKDFIAAIITQPDPKRRLGYRSSREVLKHPFLRDADFASIFQDFGPIYPHLGPKRAGRGESQSISASFTEQQEEDIEIFASVHSENEAKEVAQVVGETAEESERKADEYDNFEGFDCRYI